MTVLYDFGALLAVIYCVSRVVVDFRQGKYIWAAFGAAAALILIWTPVETHAVKLDLPKPYGR